jgi:hypothetical protein
MKDYYTIIFAGRANPQLAHRVKEILCVSLGLVDDFRTFRIEQPGPEFFAFLAA